MYRQTFVLSQLCFWRGSLFSNKVIPSKFLYHILSTFYSIVYCASNLLFSYCCLHHMSFIFVICSFSLRTVIVRASVHCFLAHFCQRKEQLFLFSELQSSLEYYIVCKHIREPPGPQCFLFKGPPNVLFIFQVFSW